MQKNVRLQKRSGYSPFCLTCAIAHTPTMHAICCTHESSYSAGSESMCVPYCPCGDFDCDKQVKF